MTKEAIIECMRALEDGMCRTKFEGKGWKDNLIWYLCFACYMLLKERYKEK